MIPVSKNTMLKSGTLNFDSSICSSSGKRQQLNVKEINRTCLRRTCHWMRNWVALLPVRLSINVRSHSGRAGSGSVLVGLLEITSAINWSRDWKRLESGVKSNGRNDVRRPRMIGQQSTERAGLRQRALYKANELADPVASPII